MSQSTDTQAAVPILSFRADDLVNLITTWYQVGRTDDSMRSAFADGQHDDDPGPDPFVDFGAMKDLQQEIANQLMSFAKRDDGTCACDEKPFMLELLEQKEESSLILPPGTTAH